MLVAAAEVSHTGGMSLRNSLNREVRVALSLRAQPIWFRVVKWVVLLGAGALLWRNPHFWLWVAGALALSLAMHFTWRWKTRGWTQPWGGWDDAQTADGAGARSADRR